MQTPTRVLFLAGAAGATGTAIESLPRPSGVEIRAHLRPARAASGHPWSSDPHARIGDLGDSTWLDQALAGATTVVQLVGTMRKRFSRGDTYETSDIGTTRLLIEAARRVGGIDHVVLLSSVGAGRPIGAYLQAKAAAEAIVRDSGIPWTIFRPSSFDGGPHRPPPGMGGLLRMIAALGARSVADRLRPIPLDTLASAILAAAVQRAPLHAVLEGAALWDWVAEIAGQR